MPYERFEFLFIGYKYESKIFHNGQQWTYSQDLRGTKIYSIKTGPETTMQEVGKIPDGYTILKPNSQFDSLDGEKWVLDAEKQHQYEVNQALSKKYQLISEATTQFS